MTDWSYEQINEHAEQALGRLVSQYETTTRLQAIIEIEASQTQGVENAIWGMLTEKWIDDASGVQIDSLGAIVGEPRLGRSDEAYVAAIFIRIALNSGGGQPEIIMTFLRFILDINDVQLLEVFPANIQVFVDSSIDQQIASRLRRIIGAGIGGFITSSDGETPFGFKELGEPDPADRLGFGELSGIYDFEFDDGSLLEFDDGSTLAVLDIENLYLLTGGGRLSELFEV